MSTKLLTVIHHNSQIMQKDLTIDIHPSVNIYGNLTLSLQLSPQGTFVDARILYFLQKTVI